MQSPQSVRSLFLLFIFFALLSCSPPQPKDIHSYANINDIITNHINLNLDINFEEKTLSGSATLEVENITQTSKMILDIWDLTIHSITLDEGKETTFNIGESKPDFGAPLTIDITPETKKITIHYTSSPGAEALQWLEPSQTAGKTHPFLFSQSQSILARTWVPCQDTPSIRFTYTADIRTNNPALMALMSASNPTAKSANGHYQFEMKQPIPSYLLAITAGNIEFRSLGENCGVYSEPNVVDKAAKEFEDTEKMIKAAEALYGPYRWGRYDIIVLPPSFPFGGMENPRLTFATPTIIAGDKSLVALIAHELAHSWSGNLVTNSTWDDMWLNEGFTTYFEYRIMEALYGAEYATMIEQIGFQDLKRRIESFGSESPDTKLALDLSGRHPDESTNIAYDKGALFLRTLEKAYGREAFDAFLKKYFNTFAFKTMNSDKFAKYLADNLIKKTTSTSQAVRIYKWIYDPGLPDNHYVPDSPEFRKVDAVRKQFVDGSAAAKLQTESWTTHHWIHFLRTLPANLSQEQFADLDKTFGLTGRGNSEIEFAWYINCIKNEYKPAYDGLKHFLSSVGRTKFVAPLYATLAKTDEGKTMAKELYKNNRKLYHPITASVIDKILN